MVLSIMIIIMIYIYRKVGDYGAVDCDDNHDIYI